MKGSGSLEIQLDVDASMENNGMNNMFKESNDQNGETQQEAKTSSENKVNIDQLVIDIQKVLKVRIRSRIHQLSLVSTRFQGTFAN